MLPLEDGEIGTVAGVGPGCELETTAEALLEEGVCGAVLSGIETEVLEEPVGEVLGAADIEAEPSLTDLVEGVGDAVALDLTTDVKEPLVPLAASGELVQASSAPVATAATKERVDTFPTRVGTTLLRSPRADTALPPMLEQSRRAAEPRSSAGAMTL